MKQGAVCHKQCENIDSHSKNMWGMKMLCCLLPMILLVTCCMPMQIIAVEEPKFQSSLDCKSAILMEAETGKILYEQNAQEALPPASVTKVMTLLLVMEAIEHGQLKYEDMITASAHACSMGGSQIFLKEGEQMTAEDMIKSVVIASANDAAVALAEHIAGSEDAFVAQMNQRAKELGMNDTSFENTNGLDDTATNHVTSAKDIALMSQALIRYPKITEYSSIWMDTIRNGEFGLTNTNRLIRFYKGATGLKTGSTAKAGFCISATAKRDGMSLICVIMGAPTRDSRNASAKTLLDWGFANYGIYQKTGETLEHIPVKGGESSICSASYADFEAVVPKASIGNITCTVDCPESLSAPVKKGSVIGTVTYSLNGTTIGTNDILAEEKIDAISLWGVIVRIFQGFFAS